MRAAGIVMECNPFHEGHRYIIQKAKEIAEGGPVIVIMSGDFVQRGIPAVLPKEVRTRQVLQAGADLVLELPVRYATASAETFARGAVSTLAATGVVTDLVFGSETADISTLQKQAEFLLEEPEDYQVLLRKSIREGLPFPAARAAAAKQSSAHVSLPDSPNDLLAEEYLKALMNLSGMGAASANHPGQTIDTENRPLEKTSLIPHAVKRISAPTATDLRAQMQKKEKGIFPDDFSGILLGRLLFTSKYTDYDGVTHDLANRIRTNLPYYVSWTQFCELLKTRNITYTAVSRALLHIQLDLQKPVSGNTSMQETSLTSEQEAPSYIRVIGVRKTSLPLIGIIRRSIPVVTGHSDFVQAIRNGLPASSQRQFLQDTRASELYDYVSRMKKAGAPAPAISEFSKKLIIL